MHDQSGSTRLLASAVGDVTGTYTYDAYGSTASHTGTAATALLWDGQYQDPATGLYYLRARYYDPATGQFLTPTRSPPSPAPLQLRRRRPRQRHRPNRPQLVEPASWSAQYWENAAIVGAGLLADAATDGAATPVIAAIEGDAALEAAADAEASTDPTADDEDPPAPEISECTAQNTAGQEIKSAPGGPSTTPAGRPYSWHYEYEMGPYRNIPGSVVDETIDYATEEIQLRDRTIYYDAKNNVTVVQSDTTGKIMSVRRGSP